MKEEELIQRIEDWLDDLLPDEEAAAFQASVESDPYIRSLVRLVKERRSVVEEIQAEHYLQKIKAHKEKHPPVQVPKPGREHKNYLLAAIVAAVALIVLIVRFFSCHPSEPTLPPPVKPPESTQQIISPPAPQAPAAKPQPQAANEEEGSQPKRKNDNKYNNKSIKPDKIVLCFSTDSIEMKRIEDNFKILIAKADSSSEKWIGVKDNLYVMREEKSPVWDNQLPGADNTPPSSRSDGKTGGSLYEQGLKLISQEPDKAILTLSEIPDNDPEYSLAQRALSILYYREGNYQQSVKCYERFHAINETPESDLMLAGLYLSDYKNHRDKAMKLLNGIRSDENHKFSKTAEQIYNYLIQK